MNTMKIRTTTGKDEKPKLWMHFDDKVIPGVEPDGRDYRIKIQLQGEIFDAEAYFQPCSRKFKLRSKFIDENNKKHKQSDILVNNDLRANDVLTYSVDKLSDNPVFIFNMKKD